jgi:hypothetical protein
MEIYIVEMKQGTNQMQLISQTLLSNQMLLSNQTLLILKRNNSNH